MHIKDPEYLKSQIVRSLYHLTDADPASLADYIIALLKHDKPANELEAYCLGQLQEFFHPGKAEPFVKDLLKYLGGDQKPVNAISKEPTEPAKRETAHSSNQSSPRVSRRRRSLSRSRSPVRERSSTSRDTHRNRRERREPEHDEQSGARDSITVDRLPQEACDADALMEYFCRFGPIVKLDLNERTRKAEIKFQAPEDAHKALSCPDAVMGNRFIRVFWSRAAGSRRLQQQQPRMPPPRLTPAQSTMVSEAKLKEKQERLQALVQLQKQKQELMEKYVAQQKELLQKLDNPNMGEAEKALLKESMVSLDRSIQQVQELGARPKSPVLATPIPTARTDPANFKMDYRPGAFIMTPVPTLLKNDLESFKKILTSHGVLGNFRYDETSNSALIEFVNRQEASKVFSLHLIFIFSLGICIIEKIQFWGTFRITVA